MHGAGATIREARLAQGMTQAELARRMGITQPSVARIEAAGDHVTMATLKRAAAAMDRSITIHLGAPPDSGIDETLLHALIKLEPLERLRRFESVYASAREIAAAGAAAR
jgi:transcriptional regulator with XRE-family HTH domain